LFGPVPITVITAPVALEWGELLQPPGHVAIVASSTAKGACHAPRRFADGLSRHKPASRLVAPSKNVTVPVDTFVPPAGVTLLS
jgi:hypothetical protein